VPIRLSDLANDRRDTTISTPLGPIAVTYKPNALTPADAAELAGSTGAESFRVLLKQMEKLIVKWDITGPVYATGTDEVVVEADIVVPIEAKVLQHISSDLLGELFQAIQKDKNPKSPNSPKTSNDLFAGSFD
jgi:hypothetical protein